MGLQGRSGAVAGEAGSVAGGRPSAGGGLGRSTRRRTLACVGTGTGRRSWLRWRMMTRARRVGLRAFVAGKGQGRRPLGHDLCALAHVPRLLYPGASRPERAASWEERSRELAWGGGRVQSPSGQMRRRPRGTGVAQARQNSVQKVRHSQTLLSGPLAGLASGFSSALAEGPNRPVWRKQRAEGTLVRA